MTHDTSPATSYEFPDEASLLAADVVSLEEQLAYAQRDLAMYRDLLLVALDLAHAAIAELARHS